MELGLLIFFIQSTSFTYFFTFFFKNDHKIFNFIAILLIINGIILPVVTLLSNSYLSIPINMSCMYVMLRCLFRKETKTRCAFAVVLYEAILLLSEIIVFCFLLLSNRTYTFASLDVHYEWIFYAMHYAFAVFLYTCALFRFGGNPLIHQDFMMWGGSAMLLQILNCIFITAVFLDIQLYLILLYGSIFFLIMLYLLKKQYQQEHQKKMEITAAFLQMQLQEKCRYYIRFQQQEQYRKLRHDYMNFIEQKTKQNDHK